MKQATTIAALLFVLCQIYGCVSKTTTHLVEGYSPVIYVLSLPPETPGLSPEENEQQEQTRTWMNDNLVKALARKGFRVALITEEKQFPGSGTLLKSTITDHKVIPKGVTYIAGTLAGVDRLGADFTLMDAKMTPLFSWEDTQASKHGVNYCASSINRNVVKKIVAYFSSPSSRNK